jgi:hypothetical protein
VGPGGVVFTLPTNGLRWLNANDRHKSFHSKYALAKEWRFMAGIYARSNGIRHHEQAAVKVIIHRGFDGPADVLNWSDTVKPVIDGLTDAKCWPNDDNDHVVVDIRAGETWKKPGIEIIICPAGTARRQLSEKSKRRLRRLKESKLRQGKPKATLEPIE